MKTFSQFVEEKMLKIFGLGPNHANKRLVGPVNPARPFSGFSTGGPVLSKKHGVMGQRKLS